MSVYYTYKTTFKDLPGYFYYGYHKDNGKEYFGSPVTWRGVWSQFEPEVQILQWYENKEEALKAEVSIILHTWNLKGSLNESVGATVSDSVLKESGKRLFLQGVGIHNPEYKTSEEFLEHQRLAGKEAFLQKSGIHDPNYKETNSYKTKQKEVGERVVVEGKGIHNPSYKSSEEYILQKKRNGERSRIKNSKPVKCLESGLEYTSAASASRSTGHKHSNICRSALSNGYFGVKGTHWIYL